MTAAAAPIPFAITAAGDSALRADPARPVPRPRPVSGSGALSRTIVITEAGHAALARPRYTDIPEEPRRARSGSAR